MGTKGEQRAAERRGDRPGRTAVWLGRGAPEGGGGRRSPPAGPGRGRDAAEAERSGARGGAGETGRGRGRATAAAALHTAAFAATRENARSPHEVLADAAPGTRGGGRLGRSAAAAISAWAEPSNMCRASSVILLAASNAVISREYCPTHVAISTRKPELAKRKQMLSRKLAWYFLLLPLWILVRAWISKTIREERDAVREAAIRAAVEEATRTARQEKEAAIRAATTALREEMAADQARAVREAATATTLSRDACRDVFRAVPVREGAGGVRGGGAPSRGGHRAAPYDPVQGGYGELGLEQIRQKCGRPDVFGVCDDLQQFTGLADDELRARLMRKGRFHFEGEHAFWNPTSATELAWFYATSIDYLFANAIHKATKEALSIIVADKSKTYEPVLEYSGGVGNNALYLAQKGVKVHYFGIGMAEYAFVQYRVWKRGLAHMVEFKKPFSRQAGHAFDPIRGPLPLDGSLGAILAFDVLEHIPKYHLVVEAMVRSLRVGGVIIENSPFAAAEVADGREDLRVHVSAGGIAMKDAMGPKMKKRKDGIWGKVAD